MGPVAAGFWRLALALPFLLVIAAPDRPAGALAAADTRRDHCRAASSTSLDLAAWNAGIHMTKLANATMFGNSGSFIFAIYGLVLARRARR